MDVVTRHCAGRRVGLDVLIQCALRVVLSCMNVADSPLRADENRRRQTEYARAEAPARSPNLAWHRRPVWWSGLSWSVGTWVLG